MQLCSTLPYSAIMALYTASTIVVWGTSVQRPTFTVSSLATPQCRTIQIWYGRLHSESTACVVCVLHCSPFFILIACNGLTGCSWHAIELTSLKMNFSFQVGFRVWKNRKNIGNFRGLHGDLVSPDHLTYRMCLHIMGSEHWST